MASRNVSPGGTLLRASRLFSIPAPLSRPIGELTAQAVFNSNTATGPHPVHLSITTPASSLSKGDWGFKRPLPLRSTTKSSTPLIRVLSVDTSEHITEYASSADHTITLQKWQEMNIPMTTPKAKQLGSMRDNPKSAGEGVFEEALDGLPVKAESRWKFGGPWLPGQTVGEFNEYLEKDVRKRKAEFRLFLREQKALRDTSTAQQRARDRGEDLPPQIKSSDITDKQLIDHIHELRHDRTSLFALIRKFLDLPPAPMSRNTEDDYADMLGGDFSPMRTRAIKSEDFLPKTQSPYAETGPPRTHPSAGLSYLRSGAYVFNHPLYGPQASPPPVEARVVMPKGAAVGAFAPKLGVGGVVTDVPVNEKGFNTSSLGKKYQTKRITKESNPGLVNIEPEKVGGSKIWVEPKIATIDARGRISLTVSGATDAAVAVHKGTVDDLPASVRRPYVPPQPIPPPVKTTYEGYGLESPNVFGSLPNVFGTRPKTNAGQNAEWAVGSQSGVTRASLNEDDAYEALKGLMDGKYDTGAKK